MSMLSFLAELSL